MPTTPMTAAGLADYLQRCRAALPQKAVFVCGHDAPDTDAVISSVAEAYRRHLCGEATVPLIPAHSLPAEIAWLLGEELTQHLLVEREVNAENAHFILTDHHDVRERRVVAIVDHHRPTAPILDGIETDIRPVGSTTTLVAERCFADGLVPDAAMARILLGGILADTEGLSPAKTRPEDYTAAERLTALWGGDAAALFADLRRHLLAEGDLATLYHRDYRRFGDAIGFAVIKVWDTTSVDESALRKMLVADRKASGVAATLAKITRYGQNGLKNETYLINAPSTLAHTLVATIRKVTGDAAIACAPDRIDLPANAAHLSRKQLVPILLERMKNP